jgi:cobalt/nickel transport system permease protein
MHIADGILPTGMCLAAHAAAWAGVWGFGRGCEPAEVVRMGFLASTAFVVSLVHFPLGGTTIHFGLFGLAGILLGRRAFPVIFATLLFQALLFQHGGLLTLGVNTINMGAGALAAAAIWRLARMPEAGRAFLCGLVGTIVPALLMASEFSWANYGRGFYFLAGLYLAVGAFEALLTVAVVSFLRRTRPAILIRAAAT